MMHRTISAAAAAAVASVAWSAPTRSAASAASAAAAARFSTSTSPPSFLHRRGLSGSAPLVPPTVYALGLRGGGLGDGNGGAPSNPSKRDASSSSSSTSSGVGTASEGWTKLSDPAPGSPFHHAFPVHNLDEAKRFYGDVLGCQEGRSSEKWQDYSLHGHQIVCHWVGNDYRCVDYYNPVDGDEVPVPHFGLALTEEQFHALADRVRRAGVEFIIEPHLRFKGQPGEQWTMFFKDPSGNNLEFKSMTTLDNLFAKYNVSD